MRDHLERILYHESTILARLDEMAQQIGRDYAGKDLAVVAVMNGSLMFLADLLRRIPLPLRFDCLAVASYHGATRSSGRVDFLQAKLPDIDGRHVLVLDDILDSGTTLDAFGQVFHQRDRTFDIGPDGFAVETEISTDGGKTWFVATKYRYRRAAAGG